MKYTTILEDGRNINYEENIWTGKKQIFIDGEKLTSPSKKIYLYNEETYKLTGSYLLGVKLVGQNEIVIVPKLKTWEYVLALLPFIMVFIGGAIGGLFGALFAISTATVMRKFKNVFAKVATSLIFTATAFVLWYLVAVILLAGLSLL